MEMGGSGRETTVGGMKDQAIDRRRSSVVAPLLGLGGVTSHRPDTHNSEFKRFAGVHRAGRD